MRVVTADVEQNNPRMGSWGTPYITFILSNVEILLKDIVLDALGTKAGHTKYIFYSENGVFVDGFVHSNCILLSFLNSKIENYFSETPKMVVAYQVITTIRLSVGSLK